MVLTLLRIGGLSRGRQSNELAHLPVTGHRLLPVRGTVRDRHYSYAWLVAPVRWLGALTMAIVILSIYMVIDCYADRVEEDRLRDLQRRVVELEQQVKR